MEFLNTLGEIRANKDNFKKWEEAQRDEDAKRDALYKRRKHTEAEIAKAKALGTKIIDVVDIMDNHSESVAENVETATQPIVSSAPLIAFFGSGSLIGKFVIAPAFDKIWDIKQELHKKHNTFELGEQIRQEKANEKFDRGSFFRKQEIEKIQNPELRKKAMTVFEEYTKEIAPHVRKQKLGFAGIVGATIASFLGINLYTTKLQIDSSRIARYQAREFLKDPKAFVNYTPEQIAKAKEEIAKHPEWLKEKQEEGLKSGFFKSLWNLRKDRKAYKEYVKNDTDESKLVTRALTPEEIKEAEKDKEVIQRTVRIVNNEAEKYSQRMEVAADVIIGSTPFLGYAVGGATAWGLNKAGVIDKFVDNKINKNGSETTKKIYENLKKTEPNGFFGFIESVVKTIALNTSYLHDLERSAEKGGEKVKVKAMDQLERILTSSLAHTSVRNKVIGVIGGLITGTVGAFIGLKLQKDASRAGRYTAKTELEKNPNNFIGYTQDDYKEVQDVKAEGKQKSNVKEIVTFLPNVFKQYFAYQNYKKTELKEKQLLQKELQKQDVSDEQLKEAKNLQRKLFNTFEKVDDNSQKYSETTEAAINIAQPFVTNGGIALTVAPFLYGAYQLKKGSAAQALNKITGFFANATERLQSSWFKKYLNSVADNVAPTVQNTSVEAKPIKSLLEGVDFEKDNAAEILSKMAKQVDNLPEQLSKMTNKQQEALIEGLRTKINSLSDMFDGKVGLLNDINHILAELQYGTNNPQTRADALKIILNPKHNITGERFNNADEYFRSIMQSLSTNQQEMFLEARSIFSLTKMICDSKVNVKEFLKDLKADNITEKINNSALSPETKKEITDTLELYKNILEGSVDDLVKNNLDAVRNISLKAQMLLGLAKNALGAEKGKIVEPLETFMGKIQQIANGNEPQEIKTQLIDEINASTKNMIDKTIETVRTSLEGQADKAKTKINIGELLNTFVSYTKPLVGVVKPLAEKSDGRAKDIVKYAEYLINAAEQKSAKDGVKSIVNSLKKEVEGMTDEQFAQKARAMNFSSMDKKTMLEILPRVEKIIDNIPTEELTKIQAKIFQAFKENPDEFIKLMSSGELYKLYMTPGLQKIIAAAGISFAAFTMTMTYIVSSWLGELQLKAGRLGVMKAIEGLNDNRYYANVEPQKTVTKPSQVVASKVINSKSTNLLKQYM